jgi:hypothetical protein
MEAGAAHSATKLTLSSKWRSLADRQALRPANGDCRARTSSRLYDERHGNVAVGNYPKPYLQSAVVGPQLSIVEAPAP